MISFILGIMNAIYTYIPHLGLVSVKRILISLHRRRCCCLQGYGTDLQLVGELMRDKDESVLHTTIVWGVNLSWIFIH